MLMHNLNPYGLVPVPQQQPKIHKKTLKKYVINAPNYVHKLSHTFDSNIGNTDVHIKRGLSLSKSFNNTNQCSDYRYNFGTNTMCNSISDYGRKQNLYYANSPIDDKFKHHQQIGSANILSLNSCRAKGLTDMTNEYHNNNWQPPSLHKFQTFGQLKNSGHLQSPPERISLKRCHSVGHYYNRCSISNKFSQSEGFTAIKNANEYLRGSIIDQLTYLQTQTK